MRAPDSTETFDVSYKYNYFDTVQRINNFTVNTLIILKRTKDRITMVGITTLPEDIRLSGLKYFEIGYLNKLRLTVFETPTNKYEDVLVIETNTNCSCASKIYWSKSNGMVGFDKRNEVHYTLSKRYPGLPAMLNK